MWNTTRTCEYILTISLKPHITWNVAYSYKCQKVTGVSQFVREKNSFVWEEEDEKEIKCEPRKCPIRNICIEFIHFWKWLLVYMCACMRQLNCTVTTYHECTAAVYDKRFFLVLPIFNMTACDLYSFDNIDTFCLIYI